LLIVSDLKLKGDLGKGHLMFISCYGWSRVFIANYGSWQEYPQEGRIAKVVASFLSHESLHISINWLSLTASANLDKHFGRSGRWDLYRHSSDYLDVVCRKSSGKCVRAHKQLL